MSSCKTSQKSVEKVLVKSQNPIINACNCKNEKGVTVRQYAENEQKQLGLNDEEYQKHIQIMLYDSKEKNWFITDFVYDTQYSDCLKAAISPIKDNQNNDFEKWMNEIKQEYPVCYQVFPILITVASKN